MGACTFGAKPRINGLRVVLQAYTYRAVMDCMGQVAAAAAAAEASAGATVGPAALLVGALVDHRPKVRRRAQASLETLLAGA